jgi:hypothetical protein
MPRWNISKDDLADLIAFLKTLPSQGKPKPLKENL